MCFLVPINVVMSHKQQGQIPIFFFPGGQSKIIKFRNSKFKGLKLLMTSTRVFGIAFKIHFIKIKNIYIFLVF